MALQDIAQKLVELARDSRDEEAVAELYSPQIVSIEGSDFAGMPARMEGIEAVNRKGDWWRANHEVHNIEVGGPFIGKRDDQFVVSFDMDVTPKDGARMQMSEVGIYTVKDGKIVQEEYLYRI